MLQRRDHFLQHGRVQRVEGFRTIERQKADLAAGFNGDRLVSHG